MLSLCYALAVMLSVLGSVPRVVSWCCVAMCAGKIDPPTLSMVFSPNTSPLAGREGTQLTGTKIGERLQVGDSRGGLGGGTGLVVGSKGGAKRRDGRYERPELYAVAEGGQGRKAAHRFSCTVCMTGQHSILPPSCLGPLPSDCRLRPRRMCRCGCCLWWAAAVRVLRCRREASCSWGCS
jgi:hypothetical protein